MPRSRKSPPVKTDFFIQQHQLQQRLKEAEETLQAIREGAVDALVVETSDGEQVYTLKSADYPYRMVIDNMTQGAVMFDENGLIFYANATFAAMVKRSSEDIFGNSIYAFMTEGDREFFENLASAHSGVAKKAGNITLIGENRNKLSVFVGIISINIDGQHLCCAILTDLTEQIKYDQALVEEKFSRMILEQTGEAVVVCDTFGRIIRTSRAIESLVTQYVIFKRFHDIFRFTSPENSINTQISELPWDQEGSLLTEVLEGKSFRGLEVDLLSGPRKIPLLLSAQPLQGEEGNTIGAVITMIDITQRKQIEGELQELNDSLEQRILDRTEDLLKYQKHLRDMASELVVTEQRERRRLATELHDYLAQLLVVCRMKLAQMDRHDWLPELKTNMDVIDKMLTDSLTYTRTLIAELSPNILYELGIGPALVWLGAQLERHGLTVQIRHEGGNIQLQEDFAIFVFQSVRELLYNVMKHADTKQASVTIRTTTSQELQIIVEDTGKGFISGNKVHDYATPGKFGLFSIRERLENLGGNIHIESEAGRGTRITLLVPCTNKPSSEVAQETRRTSLQPPLRPSSPKINRKGIRILLVDDHALVRQGIRGLLEIHSDFLVVGEAQDGLEAIEMTRTLQPDIVIMDINMPRLNGIEATKRIMQEFPSISTIGLSVHEDRQVQKLLQEAGAVLYLTKNGISSQLVDGIRSVATRSS